MSGCDKRSALRHNNLPPDRLTCFHFRETTISTRLAIRQYLFPLLSTSQFSLIRVCCEGVGLAAFVVIRNWWY